MKLKIHGQLSAYVFLPDPQLFQYSVHQRYETIQHYKMQPFRRMNGCHKGLLCRYFAHWLIAAINLL